MDEQASAPRPATQPDAPQCAVVPTVAGVARAVDPATLARGRAAVRTGQRPDVQLFSACRCACIAARRWRGVASALRYNGKPPCSLGRLAGEADTGAGRLQPADHR